MIRHRQTGGRERNVTIEITGLVMADVPLTPIKTDFLKLKLKSVVWVVQEKMVFHLWWNRKDEFLIMPIESRNSVRLDTGLLPPEEWDGQVWLESFGYQRQPDPRKGFLIILDFDR